MFFRVKSVGSHRYLQIVHSTRQGQKVRQQVFGTLGRLDKLKASGQLEALIRSGLRHCEKFALIDAHAAGETEPVRVLRIGPELVFGRLWQESGIHEVVGSLLVTRGYEFEKGRYVEITDEDLDKADVELTKTIQVMEFVSESEIDPVYFDKPYYLEPQKGGERAYALMRDALAQSGKVGVARVVLKSREHLAAKECRRGWRSGWRWDRLPDQ